MQFQSLFFIFRLAVGVTIERVIAVRFPLHARVYLKRSRIAASIVITYILAALMNQFFLFMLHVKRMDVCLPDCTLTNQSTYLIAIAPPGSAASKYGSVSVIITVEIDK